MKLGDTKPKECGISYLDAIAKGLKYYYGKPCKNCNGTLKRTSRRRCYPCEARQRREAWAKFALASPARLLWMHAKARAKRDSLPFNITVADIEKIWPKDNRCPIFPEIILTPGIGKGTGPKPNSPTLDKLIPSKGYVNGNIAVVSFRANRIRQDETDPEVFHRIANWMEDQLWN